MEIIHKTSTWGYVYNCYLANGILKMAGFNSKYDFAPRLENPEETEEIDENSLEEIFITEFELACLDVCYKSPASTQTEEARQEIKMLLK